MGVSPPKDAVPAGKTGNTGCETWSEVLEIEGFVKNIDFAHAIDIT
jgi:hypothetical protein